MAVRLPEVLTQSSATASLAGLRQALAQTSDQAGAVVQLDAGALKQFDSVALAVVLELQREARLRGQSLRLLGMPQALFDLARLYGVAQLLGSEAGPAPT